MIGVRLIALVACAFFVGAHSAAPAYTDDRVIDPDIGPRLVSARVWDEKLWVLGERQVLLSFDLQDATKRVVVGEHVRIFAGDDEALCYVQHVASETDPADVNVHCQSHAAKTNLPPLTIDPEDHLAGLIVTGGVPMVVFTTAVARWTGERWDIVDLSERLFATRFEIFGVALTRDGTRLYVGSNLGHNGSSLAIVEPKTGEVEFFWGPIGHDT